MCLPSQRQTSLLNIPFSSSVAKRRVLQSLQTRRVLHPLQTRCVLHPLQTTCELLPFKQDVHFIRCKQNVYFRCKQDVYFLRCKQYIFFFRCKQDVYFFHCKQYVCFFRYKNTLTSYVVNNTYSSTDANKACYSPVTNEVRLVFAANKVITLWSNPIGHNIFYKNDKVFKHSHKCFYLICQRRSYGAFWAARCLVFRSHYPCHPHPSTPWTLTLSDWLAEAYPKGFSNINNP